MLVNKLHAAREAIKVYNAKNGLVWIVKVVKLIKCLFNLKLSLRLLENSAASTEIMK